LLFSSAIKEKREEPEGMPKGAETGKGTLVFGWHSLAFWSFFAQPKVKEQGRDAAQNSQNLE
jgi:hypothetical protein